MRQTVVQHSRPATQVHPEQQPPSTRSYICDVVDITVSSPAAGRIEVCEKTNSHKSYEGYVLFPQHIYDCAESQSSSSSRNYGVCCSRLVFGLSLLSGIRQQLAYAMIPTTNPNLAD